MKTGNPPSIHLETQHKALNKWGENGSFFWHLNMTMCHGFLVEKKQSKRGDIDGWRLKEQFDCGYPIPQIDWSVCSTHYWLHWESIRFIAQFQSFTENYLQLHTHFYHGTENYLHSFSCSKVGGGRDLNCLVNNDTSRKESHHSTCCRIHSFILLRELLHSKYLLKGKIRQKTFS